MNASNATVTAIAAARTDAWLAPLLAAMLLGAVIVFGVEFSEAPAAHNAAHDVRHANGRPCH